MSSVQHGLLTARQHRPGRGFPDRVRGIGCGSSLKNPFLFPHGLLGMQQDRVTRGFASGHRLQQPSYPARAA